MCAGTGLDGLMNLRELLRLAGSEHSSAGETTFAALRTDSRKVGAGDVFLAYPGTATDGRKYIDSALAQGAVAVLSEPGGETKPGRPVYEIPGLKDKAARLFDAWHGFPTRDLLCIAVTGTNGKTTTALLVASILKADGRKPMYFGTIHYDIGGEILPAALTTPGPEEFFSLLRMGRDRGCDALVMEVSSHSLHQNRIAGLAFTKAVFTNLTQDHLDYHPDMEAYFQSKRLLFANYLRADGQAVINVDSPYGARLAQEAAWPSVTFSQSSDKSAEVRLIDSQLSLEGTHFRIATAAGEFDFRSALVGRINLENLTGAVTLGYSLGLSADTIADGIRDVTVPGRNEIVDLGNGAFAVIDYAHTPDALKRVLQSLKALTPGRLVCMFGCGGDRDRGKRSQMGRIAEEIADVAVITSDNPRTEAAGAIIQDILGGLERPDAAIFEEDRKAAIHLSLNLLVSGDCLLIAGKGHEDYQIIGATRYRFSDREQVMKWVEKRMAKGTAHGN